MKEEGQMMPKEKNEAKKPGEASMGVKYWGTGVKYWGTEGGEDGSERGSYDN